MVPNLMDASLSSFVSPDFYSGFLSYVHSPAFYSGFLSYVHSPAFYADKKAARSSSPLPFLGRSAGLYPASLSYLLSRYGINFLPAEDEDLAVTNNLCTLYIVPLYILNTSRSTFACRGEATGIGGDGLIIGILGCQVIAVLGTTIQSRYRELQAICGHDSRRSMCLSVARRRKSNAG